MRSFLNEKHMDLEILLKINELLDSNLRYLYVFKKRWTYFFLLKVAFFI